MFAASKSGRAVSAATTDPYFPYVPLLLETTSTNGQQNNTFLDSSTNNFTLTRNGTPTQGSVTPYWPDGYWSNYFNGSTDYLSVADNAALELGAGNFTLEGWFNFSSLPSTNGYQATLFSKWATSNSSYEFYLYNSSGTYALYLTYSLNGSTSTNLGPISFTPALNAWYHIAVCRSSTNVIFYVNGTQQGSTQTLSGTIFDGSGSLSIGNFNAQANTYFNGYVSNARIVKGVAVYTGTFTPPTLPLTATQSAGTNIAAITGTATSLLTCQSNRFKDNSTNAFAITVNGTPKVQAFQPFSPPASYTAAAYGGSGYFNGTTDYLTTPANTAFAFGTGDFTVEAWIYTTSRIGSGNFGSQIAGCQIYGVSADWLFCLTAGGLLYFQITSSITGAYVSTSTVPLNAWTHVAFVRASGVVKAFINGVDAGNSGTYATSVSNASTSFSAGGASNGSASSLLQGYISNLRIVKGTAVYTGAFTPPTLAPLTTAGSTSAASYSSTINVNTSFASSATSLLTNFTNAGIYDAAVQNNQITVGDAQASTTQYKWSPTSMKFDGTGDWLTAIDGPQLQLLSGDFTIEGWVYLSATGVAYGIISKGTASTGWSVNVTSGNKLQFSYTASNLTGATSLASATWYYFAVVRSGSATGNLKVYLNGTADATSGGAVTDNFNQTSILYVGADRVGTSPLNGYLQDVRITKGYARTITTPTAAFPTR